MGNANEKSNKGIGSDCQTPQPLQFHPTCHSDNVQVDGGTARRVESFCKGICFGNRPVRVGEHVTIRLALVATNWSGVLRFGFTCKNPEAINASTLPRYACPDLTNIQGQFWAKALPERMATQGAILSYSANDSGEVHYSVDNVSQGLFFSGVDTSKPLWPLIDIYGNTTVVELVRERTLLNNVQNITHTRPILDLPIRYHSLASLRPMEWHHQKGKHANISEDRRTALRAQAEYCNAYVFTSRPLQAGERLVVQVLAIDPAFSGGLTFGLTTCDPSEIDPNELPEDADELLNRLEYWIVNKDVVAKPEAGDELSFLKSSTGEVKFCKNGGNQTTLLHVDATADFWVFFDMYGCTIALKCLGVQIPVSNTTSSASFRVDNSQPLPIQPQTVNLPPQQVVSSTPALPPRPSRQTPPQRPPRRQPPLPPVPPRPSNIAPHRDSLSPNTSSQASEIMSTSLPINCNIVTDSEEANDNANNECAVCFEADVNCVIYRCGHLCVCFKCGQDIKEKHGLCPICRETITDVIMTFRT